MTVKVVWRSIRVTLLIGREVYRWATRERMMYGFLLLALLFILMANVPFVVDDPAVFSGQTPQQSAVHIGFVVLHIFIPLIAIFVTVSVLQSFLGRANLILLLSKPVRSWQVLAGAVIGLFQMIFLNWLLMTAGLWFILVSQTRLLAAYLWPGMSIALLMGLLCISLTIFFYLLVPNAMAGILTILMLVAGLGGPLAHETFLRESAPSSFHQMLALSTRLLPQVNALWGVSMARLHMFELEIDAGGVITETLILIFVILVFGFIKFQRTSRF